PGWVGEGGYRAGEGAPLDATDCNPGGDDSRVADGSAVGGRGAGGAVVADGDRDGLGPFLGVGVAAADGEHPTAHGDRAGRAAAVTPVNRGRVVGERFRPTRVGEGGYRLAGRGGPFHGGKAEPAGWGYSLIGDGDRLIGGRDGRE